MLRIIWNIRMLLLSENELFYINGSETLPPPLSRTEEAEIMQRISGGECEARELLIVHNLRLVVYIAKKFESPAAGAEDLQIRGLVVDVGDENAVALALGIGADDVIA